MNYKSIFRHFWINIKGDRSRLVVLLVSFALATSLGTSVVTPLLYGKIIDIVNTQGLAGYNDAMTVVVWLALVFVGSFIFYRIGDYNFLKFELNVIKKLQDYSFDNIKGHSYSYYTDSFSGAIIARSKRFIGSFITILGIVVWHFWLDSIQLLGTIVVLFYLSPVLAMTFAGWLIAFSLLTYILVKLQIPKSLKSAESDSRTTARLSDLITNIITVKMFSTERTELESFKKVTARQKVDQGKAWFQEGFWGSLYQSIFVTVFEILLIAVAVWLWGKGEISAGSIVIVQVYLFATFELVWGFSKQIVRLSGALSDANEMVQMFDQEKEIRDDAKAEKLKANNGGISIKDVTFSYENSNDVFNALNLEIEPGEKIALVGHSGAGKSTVVKILLRFLDINSGSITIDGQDISKVTQESLRKSIAYVPQDPSLFHRTLRENISYAKPDATMDEIVEVAKRAHAHEFIEKLSDGYESLVGERGVKLSGGERQRVAIARAMLKDAPIIVLDEATSALDSISEGKIQDAFAELTKGKTTIVIAHRLSTIKGMDRIIVFDKGEIVETGTHTELVKKKGVYAELWDSQVGGFIE